MRLAVQRLSVAVLLVALVFALPLDAQVLGRRNCTFVCNRTVDTAQCGTARFLGQGNCKVVANCYVVIHDADGPFGPASPELRWQCSYDCAFETCIWV
jgi:hypothetical protein